MLISVPTNRIGARHVPLGALTLPAVGEFWTLVQGQLLGGSPTGFQVLLAATGVVAIATWGFKAVSRQARRMKKQIEQ